MKTGIFSELLNYFLCRKFIKCIRFILPRRMAGDRKRKLTIAEVNALTYDKFIAIFGNVVENCALCSAVAWRKRPFRNYQEMQATFNEFIDKLSISGR